MPCNALCLAQSRNWMNSGFLPHVLEGKELLPTWKLQPGLDTIKLPYHSKQTVFRCINNKLTLP